MKRIAKPLALALALALAFSLAACGGNNDAQSSSNAAAPSSAASNAQSVAESTPASDAEMITLTVGASPAPHAEILEVVKPILAEEGINLVIQEYTDYIIPNKALDEGDIDANYFQHEPYLIDFNEKNGTDLVAAAKIHLEPLGLYPGKCASLDAFPDGGQIAVPNDATNEGRALLLLQQLGLITLKEDAGLKATPMDIVDNPKNIKIVEIEAAQVVNTLPDVDLAVINGNYAVGANIGDTMIESESKDSPYNNVIAVRAGDEARPEIQKLIAALQSDAVRDFINEKYNGVVVPTF